MTGHRALGPGKEFDAVRSLVARWGPRATGIGDDAAVLDVPPGEHLVVSTDTSVAEVHFRRDWLSPHEIGWRSTMAALSDLAAMGARPLGVLAALTVPEAWRAELDWLGDGIADAAEAVGTTIVGGDLTSGAELALCITVLGAVKTPLARSGARPGDALWVTGALGGPGAALRSWLDARTPPAAARARFARPEARIGPGQWLAAHGATAAIDISDGLVSDAAHLAAASGVALSIELGAIPVFDGVAPAEAAASGEEYELVAAGPADMDHADFRRTFGLALTRVGDVRAADGEPRVTVTSGGARVEIRAGYDHFSS